MGLGGPTGETVIDITEPNSDTGLNVVFPALDTQASSSIEPILAAVILASASLASITALYLKLIEPTIATRTITSEIIISTSVRPLAFLFDNFISVFIRFKIKKRGP